LLSIEAILCQGPEVRPFEAPAHWRWIFARLTESHDALAFDLSGAASPDELCGFDRCPKRGVSADILGAATPNRLCNSAARVKACVHTRVGSRDDLNIFGVLAH
jgi:hypothetical protein